MGIILVSLNATRSVFPNLLIFNKRNNEVKHLQLKLIEFIQCSFFGGNSSSISMWFFELDQAVLCRLRY